jgi:Cu/Ag efflux protein CusF
MKLTTLLLSTTIGLVTVPALVLADNTMSSMPGMDSGQSMGSVESSGTITAINHESHKVTLSHEPIPELSWPRMTMGFLVDSSVDIEHFNNGDSVAFTLTQTKGGQTVTHIEKE